MKKFVLGAALLAALSTAQAQTVDEIAAKHLEAIGGKANLDKIQNVVMDGTVEMMGVQIETKLTKVPGKLSRQEMTIMGKTGYILFTDTAAWMFMPIMGQSEPQPLPAEAVNSAKGQMDLTDGLIDYKTKGNKIALQGKEDIAGADCYKMQVISPAGDTSQVYIDTKTYLLARTSAGTKKFMDQEVAANIDYSDYKDVDGVKFPFTMITPQGSMTFTTIKINQPLDPKVYNH